MIEILNQWDTDLLLAINGWRSEWADSFMWLFSDKLIWIPMYASILYVVIKNFPRKVALGCVVAIALTIVFADQMGASVLRPCFERMRPSNLENPISEFIQIVNGKRGGRYGFPSCHAANTFGLAFFLVFLFRNRLLSGFMLIWAVVTCYSRSYLGVHYPGDLLAGMLVGLVGALLCYALFRTYVNRLDEKMQPAPQRQLYVPVVTGGCTILLMAIYSLF